MIARVEKVDVLVWNKSNGLRGHWRNTPSQLSLIFLEKLLFYLMEIDVSHLPGVVRGGVFDEIIGKVFFSLLPIEMELFLFGSAANTVEEHTESFGEFSSHIFGKNSIRGCTVCFDGCWRLWMYHLC